MTEEQGTVLERVKKLLAHADSAKQLGSAEEAETFAAKASELLLRHKLSMTDIEMATELSADVLVDDYFDAVGAAGLKVSKQARTKWLESLLGALCRSHFCEFAVVTGTKTYRIIGHESDRQLVTYLFSVLAKNAERLAILYERKVRVAAIKNGDAIPVQPKRAFLLGFAAGVGAKLREQRDQIERDGGKFALVRFAAAQQAVTAYFAKQKFSKVGSPSAKIHDGAGFAAGKEAGKSQSLHGGLAGGAAKPGTLAKGQQLLGGGA